MKKKLTLSIIIVALLSSTLYFYLRTDFGVRDVRMSRDGTSIIFRYNGVRAYSVRKMDENENEYRGDYLVEYDGSIGKHRIEIRFYDSEPSHNFLKKYSYWEVYELNNVPNDFGGKVFFKVTPHPDHGFIIYVGSDVELSVDEVERFELNIPFGNIAVNIR